MILCFFQDYYLFIACFAAFNHVFNFNPRCYPQGDGKNGNVNILCILIFFILSRMPTRTLLCCGKKAVSTFCWLLWWIEILHKPFFSQTFPAKFKIESICSQYIFVGSHTCRWKFYKRKFNIWQISTLEEWQILKVLDITRLNIRRDLRWKKDVKRFVA